MTDDLVHRLRAAVEEAAQALKQQTAPPARDWLEEALDPAGDGLTDEAALSPA